MDLGEPVATRVYDGEINGVLIHSGQEDCHWGNMRSSRFFCGSSPGWLSAMRDLQTGGLRITWELVRNAHIGAPADLPNRQVSGDEGTSSAL